MSKRLPPNVGLDVGRSLLYNPYQQEFLKARRLRYAPCCKKIGACGSDGLFRCPACGKQFAPREAQRIYTRLGLFAGRRGGKSVVGAWGAREECMVPGSVGWVSGPTEKILHDATMPAFLKLIPREWCENWDAEHSELTLINGALIMFRSLHDPDRGHCGVGVDWAWFDEAAFIDELAWDYFSPALTDFGGVAFFTSSVDGFDWTYERIEKKAFVEKKPGFWACKWRTIDNPFIATYRAAEVEDARASMPPQLFRQEYEGERENFTGSVYGEWIDESQLVDDAAVQAYIPEWPAISPSRRVLIGLDSGADHPFGAVMLVVTDRGIVAVREYLERQRAFSAHLGGIQMALHPQGEIMWAANRNEAQLRLEFSAHGILVAPAENDQTAGTQRVLSWLYTKQLKFAYTVPRTFDQMKKYRYAKNTLTDGTKLKEKVFKKEDELPDCVRYALMTWPSLPHVLAPMLGRDVTKLDARTRDEIEKMKDYANRGNRRDLVPADAEYPMGNFYGVAEDEIGIGL
jgi:phage terminase large subunit